MRDLFINSAFLLVAAGYAVHTVNAQVTVSDPPKEITSVDILKQRPVNDRGGIVPEDITKEKSVFIFPQKKARKYRFVSQTTLRKSIRPVFRDKMVEPTNGPSAVSSPTRDEQIGVTFWKLRPRRSDEPYVVSFQVSVGNTYENWTAERVASATKFKPKDRVRFSFESSRSGYLYVINCEMRTDGTLGDPLLIFPSQKIRGGYNSVNAGSLIEIPAMTDNPQFFEVEPKASNYAGEELLVIIANERLPIEIGDGARRLAPEMVNRWISQWQTTVANYDASDGEGIGYTTFEAVKANVLTRELTHSDPLPQSIYRTQVSKNQPIIIPVRMQAALR